MKLVNGRPWVYGEGEDLRKVRQPRTVRLIFQRQMNLIRKERLAKKVLEQVREDRKKEDTTHRSNQPTYDDKLVSHISCETYETATASQCSTYYFQNVRRLRAFTMASMVVSTCEAIQSESRWQRAS